MPPTARSVDSGRLAALAVRLDRAFRWLGQEVHDSRRAAVAPPPRRPAMTLIRSGGSRP